MRPLALSLLSGAASVVFGITSRTFLIHLNLSHPISISTFTHMLIAFFCLLATLACLWICLSYLLLAYAQSTHNHSSTLVRYAALLTIPRVRRHLLAAVTLSLVVAQPAYAQEYDSTPDTSPVDISWGSPDLLEIAEQTIDGIKATRPTPPTQTPTKTPSETHSPFSHTNNPLTTTPPNTVINVDDARSKNELSQRAQPPPTVPAPSSSPLRHYTVKSGDTLWDIAKTYLPSTARDSDIAQACLTWSAANPTLKNPNLIYPGQTLTIPQENLL